MKKKLKERYEDFLRRILNNNIDGCKFEFKDNPYFLFVKKHYCPACGEKLVRKSQSVVVNSGSKEAKDYDFANFDSYMKGNI